MAPLTFLQYWVVFAPSENIHSYLTASLFRCVIHYALDSGLGGKSRSMCNSGQLFSLLYPLRDVSESWESPRRDKPRWSQGPHYGDRHTHIYKPRWRGAFVAWLCSLALLPGWTLKRKQLMWRECVLLWANKTFTQIALLCWGKDNAGLSTPHYIWP